MLDPTRNKFHPTLLAALSLGLAGPATAATHELAPVADAYVVSDYATVNYGDEKDLFVHAGSTTKRTYLRFDLPALAAGEVLAGVSLQLSYAQGGNEGSSIALHHVTDDSWLESAITWSNRPDYDAAALDSQTIFLGHAMMTFNLPLSALAADQDGSLSLLLKLSDEGSSDTASFYSKEAINFPGNYGPAAMLTLNTAPIPEPETWGLMLTGLGLVGWAARRRG
jgi:hypothetical protein